MTKDADFASKDDYDVAFMEIKELVCSALILRGLDWTLSFHIHADSSQTTFGVVLGQQVDKVTYGVYYVSKNLDPAKLNYIVTEK